VWVVLARESVPPVRIAQAAEVIFYSAPLVEPVPLSAVVAFLLAYAYPSRDAIDL